MECRHCKKQLTHTFLDLGFAPPSNAYLSAKDLNSPEKYYPLKIKVCDNCWLVQTEDYAQADELFSSDYAYFSSTSSTWVAHASSYSIKIIQALNLDKNSMVIEIASNDGYLLKNFLSAGIPCLGIEPTDSTADAAEDLGIPVLRDFFGESLAKQLAQEGRNADLIIGNNVYAHVPDINDFTRGLKILLKPGGTITLEFPHLMRLIQHAQFDTVYHEHFSYLSLYTINRVFQESNLRICHVEELSTHGGSLRVYGCHTDDKRITKNSILDLLAIETENGLRDIDTYISFQKQADRIKNDLLEFLIQQKRDGNKVAAYGAAAKGNTLLNYAGIKPDLIPFVCDAAVSKQGKFLPGSHIPIFPPSVLKESQPEWVMILPWNISEEIREQQRCMGEWGGKFFIAVPELQIL